MLPGSQMYPPLFPMPPFLLVLLLKPIYYNLFNKISHSPSENWLVLKFFSVSKRLILFQSELRFLKLQENSSGC